MFRVKVWNGDELKNKHIKITSKATGGGEIISSLIHFSNTATYYYGGYKLLNHNPYYINNLLKNYGFRSYNTKSYKPSIKPYSQKRVEILNNSSTAYFAASDLETMEIDGVQIPVLITYVNKFERKSFMIDPTLLKLNKDLALRFMWEEYFEYLISFNNTKKEGNVNTILFHNLGSFDGYFIYKALLNHFNPDVIDTIIDDANKLITITLKTEEGPGGVYFQRFS